MRATYIPGTPNPWFPRHGYHGIPIGSNVKPAAECTLLHRVGPAATVERAVAVPILTPEHLWRSFQAEAEAILKVDGRVEGKDRERNRRINAAYARLWLADTRFQWAGLAAFASTQVGCGLLHPADTIEKDRPARERLQLSLASALPGANAAAGVQANMAAGAAYMDAKLGFGYAHLFLEMYPLHRFFMERGWEEFHTHLGKRRFGTPSVEITEGFKDIEQGNPARSAETLAQHEQVNILQKILYDDAVVQKLLKLNQYAWAKEFPSGNYEEIRLSLSAECRVKTGFASWFARNKDARLWLSDERMQLARQAARRFDHLLNSPERPRVEASLLAIARGGGIS